MPGVFVIVRDARGSLIHVRRRDDGACVGCIEVGLFEIVRTLVIEEEVGRGGEARGALPSLPAAAAREDDTHGESAKNARNR